LKQKAEFYALAELSCEIFLVTLAHFYAARNSGPENEDQSLFSSHFLRIRAATTKAGAAINRHCLINFGRLSPASVLLLFFFVRFAPISAGYVGGALPS
jgi:hypothetical protein